MYKIPKNFQAPFELATRYRGKPIYVYEFKVGFKKYWGASVHGQMLQVMEINKTRAVRRAKEIIEIIEDERVQSPSDTRDQKERFAYEKGEGY